MSQRYRVLANSLPRGGPFLLASALEGLNYEKYTGRAGMPAAFNFRETKKALTNRQIASEDATIGVSLFAPWYIDSLTMHQWLAGVDEGEYMMGHVPWSPEVTSQLADLGYRHLIILRDPRTLLLALLFDEAVMPRFLRPNFAHLSPAEQFAFMWNGGYVSNADVTLQPFADTYRSMVAWKQDSTCLVVRFEDLVGVGGGGTLLRQQEAVEQIVAYLNYPPEQAADIANTVSAITDPTAYTFRIDQKASWPSAVNSATIELVMSSCELLCEEAGYDQ